MNTICSRLVLALAALAATLSGALPSGLGAQGLTYALTPSARWIEWDDAVGFDRTRLLGGSAGIGFGRYVGLTGFYHVEDGIPTDLASTGLTLPGDVAIESQLTEIRQLGGAVTLGLGTGSIVPVLTGGGSVIRFAPESGVKSSQLSLDWGAGLKLVLGESLTGEVMVESSNYRLDRFRLAPGYDPENADFPLDPNAADVLQNLTLRAGVGIQLGRRSLQGMSELDDAFAERYQRPFSNFALAIEPMMGELNFAGATGLSNQKMLGARAGVDFGQFFGLRGFYWRGTESNFQSFGSMKAWGGEAQFTLAGGPGLNPYLLAGAGQMEWDDDFDENPAVIPVDQTSLIVGGGVDFNFGPRVRATVAARDFILAGSNLFGTKDLQDVSDPNELVHNWQVSAGLKFVVGGNGLRQNRAPVPSPMGPVSEQPGVVAAAPAAANAPGAAAEPGAASAPATAVPGVTTAGAAVVPTDTSVYANQAARTMVVPVPERGEIYIRFGEASGLGPLFGRWAPGDTTSVVVQPGMATESDIRTIVREELAAARDPGASPIAPLDQARLREMQDIERRLRDLEERGGTVVVREGERTETVIVGESTNRQTRELRPYTGLDVSATTQLLLGVAADIGPLRPNSSISLVPQFGIGIGEGPTSMLLSLGFEYRMPAWGEGNKLNFQPTVSVGPTLLKQRDYQAALTLFLGGASRLFDNNGAEKAYLFYGFQGTDLFHGGRVLIGLRRMR